LSPSVRERLAAACNRLSEIWRPDWRHHDRDTWDDIIVVGTPGSDEIGLLARHLKPQGTLCLLGSPELPAADLDIGRIHYQGLQIVGDLGLEVMKAYGWSRHAELAPGGAACFIGAGGPMGQMHLSRALTLSNPPRRVVATQNSGPRLEDLRQRFESLARSRGISFTLLDPKTLAPAALEEELAKASGGGFDDIVCIVPSAAVVEQAQGHLGKYGGFNLFAGVPVGTTARLDLNAIVHRGARFWGTSGSSIADLRSVLEKVERGELATDSVVAAVGGIRAVKEGLAAVRDARFLGKTMIYPQLVDLPLLSVAECAERYPTVRAELTEGRYWNKSAEAELFRVAR
jgi:L-sorbose 1-phosphate reductase